MASCSEYVRCPYDPSHVSLRSRLQIHICKVHLESLKANKRRCEFNSTHIVDEMEYQHHIANCPDAVPVLEQVYQMNHERQVGNVSIQEIREMSATLPTSEDWDENPTVTTTYDPMTNIENRNIMRIPVGLTKAQRKAFKASERQRIRNLDQSNPPSTSPQPSTSAYKNEIETEAPLRLPRNTSTCDIATEQVPKLGIEGQFASKFKKQTDSDASSIATTSTSSDTELETESNVDDCKSEIESDATQTGSVSSWYSTQEDLVCQFNERLSILSRAQANIEAERQKLINQFAANLKFVATTPSATASNLTLSKNGSSYSSN